MTVTWNANVLAAGILLTVGVIVARGHAAITYVRADAPIGGDGSSWASAFRDIQDAIASPSVTEVWVAEGTYRPDRSTGIRSMAFDLRAGTVLRGGFAGWEASPSERVFDAHPTILSGDLLGNDLPGFVNVGDNSFHVITIIEAGAPVVLDGFTVRSGNANGFSIYKRGGGIFSFGGSLSLVGSTIEECRATWGGGIALTGGSLSLTGSRVRSCRANFGGGVHSDHAPILASLTEFTDNIVDDNGGGIWIKDAPFLLTNGTLAGNSADNGGGVFATNCAAALAACEIVANDAQSQGAGVRVEGGSSTVLLSGCEVSGNQCISGGGVSCWEAPAVIQGGHFWANVATNGSAINVNQASLTMSAVAIEENSGSAVYAIASCAISGCAFVQNGTGLYVQAPLAMVDSFFLGNDGGALHIWNLSGGISSVQRCDFIGNDSSTTFASALHVSSGWVDIDSCVFDANVGDYGTLVVSGDATLRRSTFVANEGGASGDLRLVSECHFEANQGGSRGGLAIEGIPSGAWRPLVINTRFLGNVCTGTFGPGGLRLGGSATGANALVVNCEFSGNSSVAAGAGVQLESVAATLVNCSLVGNGANALSGDGVYLSSGSLALRNSLLWLNGGSTQATQIGNAASATVSIESSSVQGWTGSLGGSANNGLNPLFVNAIGIDGIAGSADDDLSLLPNSPAIGSALVDYLPVDEADLDGDGNVTELVPLDLAGQPRMVGQLDRGARELQLKGAGPRGRKFAPTYRANVRPHQDHAR